MEQSSLFDHPAAHDNAVAFAPDFGGWLLTARKVLARGTPPSEVWWRPDAEQPRRSVSRLSTAETALRHDGELAACHRRSDRWSLLYQLLYRLTHGEPHLMDLAADADVARLSRCAKAVRRDRHKMKAFVRFREVDDGGAEPRFVAWFEPDHHIVRLTAPFFQRRFTGMRWSILTPDACAHWEGEGEVWFSPGVDRRAAPSADRLEEAWRVYYKSIFNPARLKVNAMRAEMPQKYWRNLPEAHDIGRLIRDADQRVDVMRQTVKSCDELQCGPRPATPEQQLVAARDAAAPGSLDALRLAAAGCSACPLADSATQTVFGEGPIEARLMIVGEQPGDVEDLVGRPFAGPAGQLLDTALQAAGVSRDAAYVTNAVKHFGFTRQGRRRLHKTPTIQTVHACMDWLRQEMALVAPDFVVCLGRTAATAVLGRPASVLRERGQWFLHEGRHVLITAHPSYVLRQKSGSAREAALAGLVEDLTQVSSALIG